MRLQTKELAAYYIFYHVNLHSSYILPWWLSLLGSEKKRPFPAKIANLSLKKEIRLLHKYKQKSVYKTKRYCLRHDFTTYVDAFESAVLVSSNSDRLWSGCIALVILYAEEITMVQ